MGAHFVSLDMINDFHHLMVLVDYDYLAAQVTYHC